MRIIAGEFRGRRLLSPAGQETRPITDRVKQSLFDVIAPLLPGANVYDLFAGTGSMGLESLSRGAETAVFFEMDRSAVALLRRNIDVLGIGQRSRVVPVDIFRWFREPGNRPPAEGRVNVAFLDPPYRFLRERPDELRALAAELAGHYLSANGTIVFRHDAADELALPGTRRYDLRSYGGMVVELLGTTDAHK